MKADSFGARVNRFYNSLESPRVPRGVTVMNPYAEPATRKCVSAFLSKYFDDGSKRTLILGINPGRFGSGITGVTFTDPVALANEYGIANDLGSRRELSAEFICLVVRALGGPRKFYRRFFLSAVCPLGFTRAGKNLNYYDDKKLEKAVTPLIIHSIEKHIELGGRRDDVVILGRGKNADYFQRLNEEHLWFGHIHTLDHPRFIMQYRRRMVEEYVDEYATLLDRVAV